MQYWGNHLLNRYDQKPGRFSEILPYTWNTLLRDFEMAKKTLGVPKSFNDPDEDGVSAMLSILFQPVIVSFNAIEGIGIVVRTKFFNGDSLEEKI
tara:strand:- start:404 stop:688 length:285 start_codon:yes stop_codon:yes gene_type:complete